MGCSRLEATASVSLPLLKPSKPSGNTMWNNDSRHSFDNNYPISFSSEVKKTAKAQGDSASSNSREKKPSLWQEHLLEKATRHIIAFAAAGALFEASRYQDTQLLNDGLAYRIPEIEGDKKVFCTILTKIDSLINSEVIGKWHFSTISTHERTIRIHSPQIYKHHTSFSAPRSSTSENLQIL